jgi:FkbM family methyltransferase
VLSLGPLPIYCAGAGVDITFDIELLDRGCIVRTFDPTQRAVSHVKSLDIDNERFTFIPIGWWNRNTELDFFAVEDEENPISRSAVNLQKTTDSLKCPVKTVREHLRDQDDFRIDICKIDIEGAEYAVLDSMLADNIVPSVLLVEFDQPSPPKRTIQYVNRLKALGYRLAKFHFFDYTFIYDPEGDS